MTDAFAKTELQPVYADLMKNAFAPALRDLGLKGSNGRFELPSPTCWAQLGFQKSSYNDVGRLRFTVNLSVIDRHRWAQEAASEKRGKRPSPHIRYDAVPAYRTWAHCARIGSILPDGQDKWWKLSPETDPAVVREEVLADLTRYAVPWLRERAAASAT